MKYLIRIAIVVAGLFAWSGCQPGPVEVDSNPSGKFRIQTSNYPLAYFAERLAGENADISFLAPEGIDPAFWKPTSEQIRAFQKADLILLNGATYEKWLPTVTLSESRLVDTTAAHKGRFIKIESAVTHSHGPGGQHTHAGTAFTTWINPRLALVQVAAIRDALSRNLPEAKADIEQDFAALKQDLEVLDAAIDEALVPVREEPLMASHPIYQYFAQRYGLNLRSVLWEPDVVPPDEEWKALEETLKSHPAKWMIWEGEPVAESVKRLEAIGVRSVVFDPCGNRPESGDWLSVMEANIENLKGM